MARRPTWTLTEAVALLTALQDHLRPDWYVGLTGSVLYSGGISHNDLDVLVYPACTKDADVDALKARLSSFGLRPLFGRDVVRRKWRRMGSPDEKHVEIWEHEGRKVDLFFVR